ncbi:MAG: hypothetical protein L0Z68_04100, partial [Gammaproteobacteria bacterium]|nr:hypothetical protein [Gammaproteobacteria bacterium]
APTFVFNLVEAVDGDGRFIYLGPLLFEALCIPYTGSPLEAVFQTSNKLVAKRLLRQHGIVTPRWSTTGVELDTVDPDDMWIIKSVWEDASIGLDDNAVCGGRDVGERIASSAGQHRGYWFAERFIDGREFNVSLLAHDGGVEVLPIAEIHFLDYPPGKPKIVGYRAKWEPDSPEHRQTAPSFDLHSDDASLYRSLHRVARRCWDLFDLRGYARVDFRVDDSQVAWVLEVNVNPCLSPDAGFMTAVEQAGYSFDDAIMRILHDAWAHSFSSHVGGSSRARIKPPHAAVPKPLR